MTAKSPMTLTAAVYGTPVYGYDLKPPLRAAVLREEGDTMARPRQGCLTAATRRAPAPVEHVRSARRARNIRICFKHVYTLIYSIMGHIIYWWLVACDHTEYDRGDAVFEYSALEKYCI